MTINRLPSRTDDHTAAPADSASETPGIVAIAWPTGRPIYSYTADELADGVDLYTRAMKARVALTRRASHDSGYRDAK